LSDAYSCYFFFSSRRRHTRFSRDWSSDVCSSDLIVGVVGVACKESLGMRVAVFHTWSTRSWKCRKLSQVANTRQQCRKCFVNLRSEERRVGKGCSAGRTLEV